MAINRSQLAKELEPGLNALFGMEYARYEAQHTEIYETETSDRAFEEETLIVGFGNAEVKSEGSGVRFDNANEGKGFDNIVCCTSLSGTGLSSKF